MATIKQDRGREVGVRVRVFGKSYHLLVGAVQGEGTESYGTDSVLLSLTTTEGKFLRLEGEEDRPDVEIAVSVHDVEDLVRLIRERATSLADDDQRN